MNREEIIKILCPDHGEDCDICGAYRDCLILKAEDYFIDRIINHEQGILKEFVEHFKQILNKEIWECEDEIDCEIHCGSLEPEELEVWKAQRQVDIKRLKWAVENIDFELKLFLEK